jgi:hypothetical protein
MAMGWAQIAYLQDAATAGSGAINAAMFLERALHARGPRRTAAGLLSSLFSAVALTALGHLAAADSGAAEALLRGPLLGACIAVTTVLAMGARR